MKQFHQYRITDGEFTGVSVTATKDEMDRSATPEHGWWEGDIDITQVKVDKGGLVACQPKAPEADEWRTWRWNAGSSVWVAVPTAAAKARDIREKRTKKMEALASRYERNARQVRLGLPQTDDISKLDLYAQALADISDQPGFPTSVVWPEEP